MFIELSSVDILRTTTSAAKRPLVPEGGAYASSFDAKQGFVRLFSMQGKTRNDVLSVLDAASNTRQAVSSNEIGDMAYQAISLLGTPTNEEVLEIAMALRVFAAPSPETAKKTVAADPSGTMAVVMAMCEKTPPEVESWIANYNSLKPRPIFNELQKRNAFVGKLVDLTNRGIPWENELLMRQVSAIISVEGWNSKFAKSFTESALTLPIALREVIVENAPEEIAGRVARKALELSTGAKDLIWACRHFSDESILAGIAKKFLTSPRTDVKEKIELYEFFAKHWTSDPKLSNKQLLAATVMKTFASLDDPKTFDVALANFMEGNDDVSVRELTGNIRYSILDYGPMVKELKRKGLYPMAHPSFVRLSDILAPDEDEDKNEDDLVFMDAPWDTGEFNLSAMSAFDSGLFSRYGSSSAEKYRAILIAAIMIAVGIPVTIALSRTNTTAHDLSANPEVVRKGKTVVQNRGMNPETDQKINEIVSKAYDNAPLSMLRGNSPEMESKVEEAVSKTYKTPSSPNAAPGADQGKQSCEITRPLVDTVITLEEVKGKNYSSVGAGGMMQLMPKTWEAINKRYFEGKYPFYKWNTNRYVNRRFGAVYLQEIKEYLDSHKQQWKTDQLPLILACYHGGIGNIKMTNFDPVKIKKLMPKTYDYMIRGSNLMGQEVKRR